MKFMNRSAKPVIPKPETDKKTFWQGSDSDSEEAP